ncbi:nitrate reductase molybdenum cofactor assembly chaperone [Nonomuraea sp. NPDC050786]|uniref:nitrate reductase molybdenum cofactor assembly chaperone n=1 Tax=Nonomuraea sp. NPDC050786 TaxID=3154840 RepID=UPI0033E7B80E
MNQAELRLIHQAASLLLCYPGEDWPRRLELVRAALDPVRRGPAGRLRAFCADAAALSPLVAGAEYVSTFDRTRRRTLHMTYYADGDTRRRGQSLVDIKTVYRAHGWEPDTGELPDFLPVMLEFAARVPDAGSRLLREHRPGLDLLLAGLVSHRSRYAAVVEAVAATLPRPTPADRRVTGELAVLGPPQESVGRVSAVGGVPAVGHVPAVDHVPAVGHVPASDIPRGTI